MATNPVSVVIEGADNTTTPLGQLGVISDNRIRVAGFIPQPGVQVMPSTAYWVQRIWTLRGPGWRLVTNEALATTWTDFSQALNWAQAAPGILLH